MEIKSTEIKLVDIDQIKENESNNNRHSPEQIERLSRIIKFNGFRQPLIVSNRSGKLIAGHARLLAAQKLGFKQVPVTYQDFANEEEEYQFMVADNEIARWSELDLQDIYTKAPELNINLDLLGIEDFVLSFDKPKEPDIAPPDYLKKPVSMKGDVWLLLGHRLECGDFLELSDKLLKYFKRKTGHQAVLESTGETFDSLKMTRFNQN